MQGERYEVIEKLGPVRRDLESVSKSGNTGEPIPRALIPHVLLSYSVALIFLCVCGGGRGLHMISIPLNLNSPVM